MERVPTIALIAGVSTFLLGFVLMGILPWMGQARIPMQRMEEICRNVPMEFSELAEDYPEEFQRYFGQPDAQAFRKAMELGREVYIAEGCWHCHSQYIRPVANEDLRFGPVSTVEEYNNEMNLPHLFGTRRVGPDLIRQAGRHSNDWHVAHFYEPRSVAPYSVMPSYHWFFDAQERVNERGLAIVTYVQWLGSWCRSVPETIYNAEAIQRGEQP